MSHEREVACLSLYRRGNMVDCISFARLPCCDAVAEDGFPGGFEWAFSDSLYHLDLCALLIRISRSQIFLNFSLHNFGSFAILRAPTGKKKEWETTKGIGRNEQKNDNSLCDGCFGYGNSCFAYAKLSKQRLFRFCRGSCLSKASFLRRKNLLRFKFA